MGNSEYNEKNILPADEIATFCSQISIILQAGIPLYDGVETLVESCKDKKAKKALQQIADDVVETGMLYTAVKNAGFFPKYMVNMVHIGEEAGKLDEVLHSLSVYYEREARIKKSIKSAISYPIVLIVMMVTVVAVLVTKIMPIFEKVFKNMGVQVSKSGKSIMNIGLTVGNIAFVFTAVLLLIIIIVYILKRIGYGEALKNLSFKLPLLKGLNKKISASRFSAVIAMMLSSGYSLEKALSRFRNSRTS